MITGRPRLLVLMPDPLQAELAARACERHGDVAVALTPGGAATLLRAAEEAVAAVVDVSFLSHEDLRCRLNSGLGLVVTGPDEAVLARAAADNAGRMDIEPCPLAVPEPVPGRLSRTVDRAVERGRLRREAAALRRSLDERDARARDIAAEIREVKGLLNAGYVREMEKRIAIEARFRWSQAERRKLEGILRRVYGADDVSSLLDLSGDIKDLVGAGGVSIYILDDGPGGRLLKPLVWDDRVLSQAEVAAVSVRLDAPDLAALSVVSGELVNAPDLAGEARLTPRYVDHVRGPLRNLLTVPIRNGREVIGALEVYNKRGPDGPARGGFDAEDQQVLRDLSEHIALAMTKLNLIQYDPLTGLLRPDPFFEKILTRVNSRKKRRQEEEGAFALVMGDVDWFKAYNDRNGHEAGNRLLRDLAAVFRGSIRGQDLICRYGGEEFLFFLTGVQTMEEACLLTERIRKAVEDHYFEHQEFQPLNNLTMSFGVTLFPGRPADGGPPMTRDDLLVLVGESDAAMAEAKGKRVPPGRTAGEDRVLLKNKTCRFQRDPAGAGGVTAFRPRTFREKRRHERLYASNLVLYRERGPFKVTKTVDLSLGGVRMVTEEPLPEARPLDLILVLGEKATPVRSEVVYCRKAEGKSPYYYAAARFRDLGSEDRKTLEDFFVLLRRRASLNPA